MEYVHTVTGRDKYFDTVKEVITPGKIFVIKYGTIKPVILAWMPESSAMDGNYMIINNKLYNTVSCPCDWIPASMLTAHS